MALIMEIMKTIATPIGELALWLEETYQVNIDETIGKWGELTGMKITVTEDVISCDEVKINKKIPKTKTKDTCQHTFLSGQKAGEQCTTKPKNGAVFCSAHKSKDKDSIKSTSSTTTKKIPKKKEIKQIDPEFESDSDIVAPPPKEKKVPKKSKENLDAEAKVPKKSKKASGGDRAGPEARDGEENSDAEAIMSEPEEIAKPLLKKKSALPAKKKSKKSYTTDEEHIDKELNLSDEE